MINILAYYNVHDIIIICIYIFFHKYIAINKNMKQKMQKNIKQ